MMRDLSGSQAAVEATREIANCCAVRKNLRPRMTWHMCKTACIRLQKESDALVSQALVGTSPNMSDISVKLATHFRGDDKSLTTKLHVNAHNYAK